MNKTQLLNEILGVLQNIKDDKYKLEQLHNYVMENFANKLFTALDRRKPFANFKYLIDYSDYRKDWFAFKQNQLMAYVYHQFLAEK